MTTPRPRAAPPAPRRIARPGRERALLPTRGLPLILEDLGDLALVRVEEVVIDLRPAAELVDLEQAGWVRVGLLVEEARDHWAVAVGRVDLLGRFGAQEVHERLGLVGLVGLGDDRRGVLDQDRLIGPDEVDVFALLLRGDRLVL